MSETAAASSTPASPAAAQVPAPQGAKANETNDPAAAKPSSSGAPTKPQAPQLKEYKVNGKIVKLSPEEADQYVSLGLGSDQRFKEAAQLRKQAETVLGRLRDPKQAIEALMDPALGLSKDQIREQFEDWYSREFIEPEKLTPAEKKLKEAEARLKKYEQNEKEAADAKIREEQETLTTQQRENIQTQIIEALDTGQLPRTNFTIRRLAYWMQKNNANGFEATTQQLVSQVRKEYNENLRGLIESSDGDVLVQLLGDTVIQKLRKYDLDQLRKLRSGGVPASSSDETPTPKRSGERAPSSVDVNKRIREMQRTGRY